MLVSWILLILYVLLMFVYAWYHPNVHVQPWSILPSVKSKLIPTSCTRSDECPPHHMCMGGRCVPLFLPGGTCDPSTGDWVLKDIQGHQYALCKCKHPTLITQKHFGSNCNVDIACGTHGRYDFFKQVCDCDYGYTPAAGPTCRKMSVVERLQTLPCEIGEVEFNDIQESHGFTRDYLNKHSDKKCFKRPCTFDAFSGRPLKDGRYEDGVGCFCDPSKGLFGVRLDSPYTKGSGYNACASIFTQDPEYPVDVNLYAFFYLMNRPPISFIQFRNVQTQHLRPEFKDSSATITFHIGQEWPFDYMQYFFKHQLNFNARTRSCVMSGAFVSSCNEWDYRQNQMIDCRDITTQLTPKAHFHLQFYELLYKYPACRMEPRDLTVAEMYRGHYVLNPFQFLLTESPHLTRSNGLVLKHRDGKWTLDLAEPYNIETYTRDLKNVPNLNDCVTLHVKGIGPTAIDKRKAERVIERKNQG